MKMKQKLLALLCLILLSGCQNLSSSNLSSNHEINPTSYEIYNASNETFGLSTAIIGSKKGVININDSIIFNVFIGRSSEKDGFYDDIKDCNFYLEEHLLFHYYGKNNKDEGSISFHNTNKISLPDLNDNKFLVDKTDQNTLILTQSIEATLNLTNYQKAFYGAQEYYDDKDSASISFLNLNLDHTKLNIYYDIHAIKNDNDFIKGQCYCFPIITMENNIFSLEYKDYTYGNTTD